MWMQREKRGGLVLLRRELFAAPQDAVDNIFGYPNPRHIEKLA
jgi:hypothetical protein